MAAPFSSISQRDPHKRPNGKGARSVLITTPHVVILAAIQDDTSSTAGTVIILVPIGQGQPTFGRNFIAKLRRPRRSAPLRCLGLPRCQGASPGWQRSQALDINE